MIDLHMHTKYSDGLDSCIELLKKASEKKLEIISITDHNTALVYEELEKINIKEFFNGEIIPGIELNTKVLGVPIEILGYGFDYRIINKLVKDVYIPAVERNKIEATRLFEKCVKANIKLDDNCMDRYDSSMFASKYIHAEIVKHNENKDIISEDAWGDVKAFYRKYMSNPEGKLYVEMDEFVPDFNTAANLIREAGGLVFIPHIFEYREKAEDILNYILNNYEFDGIECYYTTFTKEQTARLVKLCNDRNLYISGGSDYHGNKELVDIGIGKGNLKIEKKIIDDWIKKVITI